MTGKRSIFGPALACAVLALALSGCGRKGPLEAPPGASATAQPAGQAQTQPRSVFDTSSDEPERPQAARGESRRILLDGLLN